MYVWVAEVEIKVFRIVEMKQLMVRGELER